VAKDRDLELHLSACAVVRLEETEHSAQEEIDEEIGARWGIVSDGPAATIAGAIAFMDPTGSCSLQTKQQPLPQPHQASQVWSKPPRGHFAPDDVPDSSDVPAVRRRGRRLRLDHRQRIASRIGKTCWELRIGGPGRERVVQLSAMARAALDGLGGHVDESPQTIQRHFRRHGLSARELGHTRGASLIAAGLDLATVQNL